MNKKALTEAGIRTKFIASDLAGVKGEKWNSMSQVREETYFTKRQVILPGKTVKRGARAKAQTSKIAMPSLTVV